MWFGIVEKPHPSLILGAYHFSILFQPTVIPVKALEVMISATLKCFFSFFLSCAPCSSTYYRRTDPAVKLTAEPAPSVGRCAINRVVCTTNRSLLSVPTVAPCAAWAVKYCGLGLKVEERIESTGNQVTVQFMSGAHLSGHGFYLSYSTTEHSGNTDMCTMPLKLCFYLDSQCHKIATFPLKGNFSRYTGSLA